MEENWKAAVGYEGLYEISDHGQVRSLDRRVLCGYGRTRLVRAQPMKLQRLNHGHLYAQLSNSTGKQRKVLVHHLVLEAFVGPRPPGLNGLHRDDDPANNHVPNLYWGTQSQNMHDKVRNGNDHNAKKTHCLHGHELVFVAAEGRRRCPTCVAARKRRHKEKVIAANRAKTHCVRGHELGTMKNGQKYCPTCKAELASTLVLKRWARR